MKTVWTSHLKTDEEKDRFRNAVIGSKLVLKRLEEIITQREQEMESRELDVAIYDRPNWDYRNAHYNGTKAALKAIKTIINLDQQENNELIRTARPSGIRPNGNPLEVERQIP